MKKKIIKIVINSYEWYTSPVQMIRFYQPKGVVYIVK
tara:strand:- start:362 stop:472 length:111 start_codon:yes stop_codon:yes gene_type:complete